MRTQVDRALVRQLLQGPAWKVIESIMQDLIQARQDRDNVGDTEWETARNSVEERGYIQGVNALSVELYKIAQDAS